MIKKRAEGKPFYVYMTAGANKFLRIYCGKVNAYLSPPEGAEAKLVSISFQASVLRWPYARALFSVCMDITFLHFPLDFLFSDYYSVSDAIKEVIVL